MKFMTCSVLLVMLLSLPGLARAQEEPAEPPRPDNPRTLQPIRVGDDAGGGAGTLGAAAHHVRPAGQGGGFRFPGRLRPWRACYRLLSDAYRRQTAHNEYEVRVYYSYDRTQDVQTSRNPGPIWVRVEPVPPRPVPCEPLQDVPEAAELCRAGCEVWGEKILPKVLVFPQHASLTQRRLAELVAYDWKPFSMPPE